MIGSRAKKGAASSRGTAHGKMGLQGLARLRHREHQLLRPATWGSSQVAGSWRSFGASATARADGHQYTIRSATLAVILQLRSLMIWGTQRPLG